MASANVKWLHLAAELLGDAASEFSSHGCNDWKWPPDWAANARRSFAEEVVSRNTGRSRAQFTAADRSEVGDYCKGDYGPPNWLVMQTLAGHLKDSA